MATPEVLNLIKDVYATDRQVEQSRCDELTTLQKSDAAWTICSDILTNSVLPDDHTLVLFASITLKLKIEKELQNLPKENHELLLQLIVQSLMKFVDTKLIRTHLCLSLVYLLIKSSQWSDPIVTITSILPDDNQRKPRILLEYFTNLAEEITMSKGIKMKSVKREILIKQLCDFSSDVNQFLLSLLCSSYNELACDVIKCYTVWIEGELMNEKVLMDQNTGQMPFVELLLKYIIEGCDENVHDACTECLCSLISICGDDLANNRDFLVKLNNILMEQIPPLLGGLKQLNEDDSNYFSLNLVKIISTLGFGLLNVFRLDIPDSELNDVRIIHYLLELTKCQHPTVVDSMLSFWDYFSDCSTVKEAERLQRFSDIFETLIENLLMLVKLDPSLTTEFINSSNPDLYRTRRICRQIMQSIVRIIGLEKCCIRLYKQLHTDEWNTAESALSLMAACGLYLSEKERKKSDCQVECPEISHVLTDFIFPMQPNQCHPAVLAASIDFVGLLADWIAKRSDLQLMSMNFLFKFISINHQSSCANSIFSICVANPSPLIHSLPLFIDACKTALNDLVNQPTISNQATINYLIKSTSILLVESNRQNVQIDVDSLISTLALAIQTIPMKTSNQSNDKRLIGMLDLICSFFRSTYHHKLKNKNECDKRLMQSFITSFHSHLWIHLSTCLLHPNINVVECSCNIFRYIVRCSGQDFEPLVFDLISSLVRGFENGGHSCMLYLSSVILDEMNNFPLSCIELLVPVIQQVINVLQSEKQYFSNPDLADDLFRLCKRLIQKHSNIFMHSQEAKNAFGLCVKYCNAEHPEALTSLLDFLITLCEIELKQGKLDQIDDNDRLMTNRDHFKSLLVRILQSVATDDLSMDTKFNYSDFLTRLNELIGSELMMKQLSDAVDCLVDLLKTDSQIKSQLSQMLDNLKNSLCSKNEHSNDPFKAFLYQLEDSFT